MRKMRSATVFLTIFTILGTVPSTGRILLVVGDERIAVLASSQFSPTIGFR